MIVNSNNKKAREDKKLDEKASNNNLFACLPKIWSGHDATTF
jgi:hypothetical protein